MQSSNTEPGSVSETGINNNVKLTKLQIHELLRSKMLDKNRIAQAEMNIDAIDKRKNEAKELAMKNNIMKEEAELKRKNEEAYKQTWRYHWEQRELTDKRNTFKSRMLTKYPILVWKSSLSKEELLALKTIRPILALYRLHRLKIKYNKLKLNTMNILFEMTNKHLANDPIGKEEVATVELINETPACFSTSQIEGTFTNKINKVIEMKIGTVNVAVDEISERGIAAASTDVGSEYDVWKDTTINVLTNKIVGSDTKASAENVGKNNMMLDRNYLVSLIKETTSSVNTSQFKGTSTNKVNTAIEVKTGIVNVELNEILGKDIVAASMDEEFDNEGGVLNEVQEKANAAFFASNKEKIENKMAEMINTIAQIRSMEDTDRGADDILASAKNAANEIDMTSGIVNNLSHNTRMANIDADIATMDNEKRKVWRDMETSAKNVGKGNDQALDKIYGLSKDKSRNNLTCNGLTYNCTKCIIGKIPGEVTKYYSCAMVYHKCDVTWRQKRQSKDKIDSDKAKCGGTLMVRHTLSDGYIVTKNKKHKCCDD
jgi:hypothetical protein